MSYPTIIAIALSMLAVAALVCLRIKNPRDPRDDDYET